MHRERSQNNSQNTYRCLLCPSFEVKLGGVLSPVAWDCCFIAEVMQSHWNQCLRIFNTKIRAWPKTSRFYPLKGMCSLLLLLMEGRVFQMASVTFWNVCIYFCDENVGCAAYIVGSTCHKCVRYSMPKCSTNDVPQQHATIMHQKHVWSSVHQKPQDDWKIHVSHQQCRKISLLSDKKI